jgi:organic radical activating enzyme
MKWYGKTLKFKRGVTIQISLLYACNLGCEYCSLEMPTGKRPEAKQATLQEWITYIKNFPAKIKEVYVSGGEPTLVKWLPELLEWLLKEGYHVTVFTNLYNVKLLMIKDSYRYQILASYHKPPEEKSNPKLYDSELRFNAAYYKLKNKYRIEVDEIGTKVLPYSRLKPFNDMDVLKDNEFRISPDLQVYISCYDHFLQKSK